MGRRAPQPEVQTLEGDPRAEVGLSIAEPRGHARKEEKLKSLFTAAKTANVERSFANPAPTEHEQTAAPAAQMGLASAAANFVSANSGGGGKSEWELPPGTHSTSRS